MDESKDMILAVLGNQPGAAHNIVALNAARPLSILALSAATKSRMGGAALTAGWGSALRDAALDNLSKLWAGELRGGAPGS